MRPEHDCALKTGASLMTATAGLLGHLTPLGYPHVVDGVTSYDDLQSMTPQQRGEHFRESLVLDPAQWRSNEQDLADRLREQALEREERLRGQAS
jgi:hypothetical protein